MAWLYGCHLSKQKNKKPKMLCTATIYFILFYYFFICLFIYMYENLEEQQKSFNKSQLDCGPTVQTLWDNK